ncbi:hypothetical protein [Burkholderia anthina]|uniref:hypothetical protein n=1 Tax=Burkholderia anthina TaxID=179879 RepID=UPI0037BFD23C
MSLNFPLPISRSTDTIDNNGRLNAIAMGAGIINCESGQAFAMGMTASALSDGMDDKTLVRKALDEDASVLSDLMYRTGDFMEHVAKERVMRTIEGLRAIGIPLEGLNDLYAELVIAQNLSAEQEGDPQLTLF